MLIAKKWLIVLLLFWGSMISAADAPFHRGVGFTDAFEVNSADEIQMNYYSRQDFINVKELGCDVVRLYISMDNMMIGESANQMDPLYFYLLDRVVDIAEQEDVHLILANMSAFNYADKEYTKNRLISIWTQMAEHYKNYPNDIYFEIANEPSDISDEDWYQMQGEVIDAIREIDQLHTIIITPPNWANFRNLNSMPVYTDSNLICTIHFYDPFIFTHQGASWAGMGSLQHVPFPYDASLMPECPQELSGTYNEEQYNSYSTEGTAEQVRAWIDQAADFMDERNIQLWCGEFGVLDTYCTNEDRVYWYEVVRQQFEERGIVWSTHDYRGGFGIFKKNSNSLFNCDLNVPLIEALGLNVPPQHEYVLEPDTTGFVIYDDYASPGIATWISSNEGTTTLYSEDTPEDGKFCIYTTGLPIWSYIDFRFHPNKDLSELLANDYFIDFWIKGDTPGAKFNMRFIDSDTGEDDHPWRIVRDIDESLAAWDGQWHHVRIPLSEFTEQGCYEDAWFDPIGAFDWGAITSFQIQTEYQSFDGMQFWFDNIKIINNENQTAIESGNDTVLPKDFTLYNNYPNPFNPTSKIKYIIAENSNVQIEIYNLLGQKVADLFNGENNAGVYEITWNAEDLSSGVYLIKLNAYGLESQKNYCEMKKAVLLK